MPPNYPRMKAIPDDVIRIITGYASCWIVLPWIDLATLLDGNEHHQYCCGSYVSLWENSNAGDYLHGKKIGWNAVSENPGDWALDIIESNSVCYINWWGLCRNTNPRAIKIFTDYIRMHEKSLITSSNRDLSANPAAVDLLKKFPNLFDLSYLSRNPNGLEVLNRYFIQFPDPHGLAYNPAPWAIERLAQFAEPDMDGLSSNSHPWAIEQLRKSPQKINWCNLMGNTGAIELIHEFVTAGKPPCAHILKNPSIFELKILDGMHDAIATFCRSR